jgi:hypothetical protein
MPLEAASLSLLAYQLGAGIRLNDAFFPSLTRMANSPADLALANPGRQADPVLAGRFNALSCAVTGPDSLNWEEIGSDLDWQGDDIAALLMGHRTHRDTQSRQSGRTAAEPHGSVEPAGLDLYFAEMASGVDQITQDD